MCVSPHCHSDHRVGRRCSFCPPQFSSLFLSPISCFSSSTSVSLSLYLHLSSSIFSPFVNYNSLVPALSSPSPSNLFLHLLHSFYPFSYLSHLASSSYSLSPSLFLSSFFIRIPSPPSWFSLLHLHFYLPPPFLCPSLPLLPNTFFFTRLDAWKRSLTPHLSLLFHPSFFFSSPSFLCT